MSVLNENTIIGASAAGGDYEIEQSLRFNGVDSHLTRTPTASPTSTKVWTCSFWVKRSSSGGTQYILNAGPFNSGNDFEGFTFFPDNSFRVQLTIGNSQIADFRTNALFRDPSAWYHFVVVRNNQAYAVYVNGVAQTFSMSTFGSNPVSYINATTPHEIANRIDGYNDFDGYLTEFNSIDGQALTPDSFGETGTYGEWKPKAYAGTYGTNGFYLPFEQDYTVEGFSTVTYEGTSASQYIGGTGFSPDLSWFKVRSTTGNSQLYDTVRGASSRLVSNATTAEATTSNGFVGWEADGFSLDAGGGGGDVNTTARTYVAWNWDMGGTTASNTSGSITSSVRANTTYGQSIVSYTSNGSTGTIGHGLGAVPDMIIVKTRNHVERWCVFHTGSSNAYIYLNETNAAETGGADDRFGNNTSVVQPTSSVFTVGQSIDVNGAGSSSINYIAYCFASVTGYSSFGSYSGNGSNTGTVVTTGFNPAFVMIKRSSSTGGWIMLDNTRSAGPNPINHKLQADDIGAEDVDTSWNISFLSNGFQLGSNHVWMNASGSTYIYMAFADTREYAYWYDQSGNNNDWTSEGGLTESDVMLDSPTNNFCTLNPLDEGGTNTVAEGNLQYTKSGSNFGPMRGTLGVTTGKWYFEAMRSSNSNTCQVGVSNNYDISQNGGDNTMGSTGGIGAAWDSRGYYYRTGGSDSGKNTFATNEIVSVAFDADTGKIWWRKSGGSWQDSGNPETGANPSFTASGYSELMPFVNGEGGGGLVANFGQDSSFAGTKTPQGNQDSNGIGDFYYAPPSGFLSLCTKSLPSVDVIPSKNFNTVLYTGTGSSNAISNLGLTPDFTWIKSRSNTEGHGLVDSVRGATKLLSSNTADSEATSANYVASLDSDGFTVGTSTLTNGNGYTYVAWNWKAGGSASTLTTGTIDSVVSANPSAGFSIVKYVGNNTANATIAHGLSQTPTFIITKNMTNSAYWATYLFNDANKKYYMNASSSDAATWITPASALITLVQTNANNINESGSSYINYCFHSVDGYSRVGEYTGNGNSDGTFVNCGFRPKYVLIRRNLDAFWNIFDTERGPYNVIDNVLWANGGDAETTSAANWSIDFLSNGFKQRGTHDYMNDNGETFFFIAFAETPFKFSNAR